MSRIEPNIAERIPGLQYAVDLEDGSPVAEAMRNVVDNLFYLRRLATAPISAAAMPIAQIQTIVKELLPVSGSSTTAIATFTVGTHLQRTGLSTIPAVGSAYFETDRGSIYIVSDASGIAKWVFAAGVMEDALANIPTDLATVDIGFTFVNTNAGLNTEYIWSGTAWWTVGGYLQSILDAVNNAVTVVEITEHILAGAGANGMGIQLLQRLRDDASATVNASALETVATVAATATFTTSWAVKIRSAGAALANFFEVLTTGIRVKVGGFFGRITHANSADRVYTFADADGNMVYETAALTNNNFMLGGGGALAKDAGYSAVPIGSGGTGGITAAAARANLSAAQIQAPGGPHTVPLAKITGGGTDGSITFNAEGVITGFVDPT